MAIGKKADVASIFNMTIDTSPIAIILPPREGFSPKAFGAVSLSVKDFTHHSRYRAQSVILGQRTEPAYPNFNYEALAVKRAWYETNNAAYVRSLVRRLRELKPCMIEVHNRPILARKLIRALDIPVALHLHNDPQDMKCAKTPAQRARLARDCAAIYCVSDWVKQRFCEGITQGAQKCFIIHCGIAVPPLPEQKTLNIVYAGRITPNKGALEFAKALQIVLPRQMQWHGTMIGGRRHSVSEKLSDYEHEVSLVMEACGERSHHLGFLPYEKTQSLFREAEIVVIPSLWQEPFGRTAIEAQAQGCAIVTSGRGGLAEIIGDTGVIVKDVTAQTLADAVMDLIRDEPKRHALQLAAHARVQEFEIRHCTAVLDEVRDYLLKREEPKRHAA